eukprot:SAG22_NODE_72_length_22344_cov_95.586559_8_plen_259_part_00
MLTGRYEHNNRVSSLAGGGCMHQNSSRVTNPGFWSTSHPVRLHKLGYTTAFFGKVLNGMNSYGCDGVSGLPPGLDRSFVMCTHTFFNCSWVDDAKLTQTGDVPADYTTSVMGNKSVAWIRQVVEGKPEHPPFYAWIGPHAPHLPSTPAPWYEDHPIGLLKAPREEWSPPYNYSGKDHHPLVAGQPILDTADAAGIDEEYSKRMRSLLSVDDLVVAVHQTLESLGEWNRTYMVFSSGEQRSVSVPPFLAAPSSVFLRSD